MTSRHESSMPSKLGNVLTGGSTSAKAIGDNNFASKSDLTGRNFQVGSNMPESQGDRRLLLDDEMKKEESTANDSASVCNLGNQQNIDHRPSVKPSYCRCENCSGEVEVPSQFCCQDQRIAGFATDGCYLETYEFRSFVRDAKEKNVGGPAKACRFDVICQVKEKLRKYRHAIKIQNESTFSYQWPVPDCVRTFLLKEFHDLLDDQYGYTGFQGSFRKKK